MLKTKNLEKVSFSLGTFPEECEGNCFTVNDLCVCMYHGNKLAILMFINTMSYIVAAHYN